MKTYVKHLGYAALTGLMVSGIAYAATQSVTTKATFDTALSLNKTADIDFGLLKAATAGDYVINTAGAITPSNGGVVIGGTPVVGQITITGSTTQTLFIQTGTYSAADHGVTASLATCEYNGGVQPIADCDAGQGGLAAPGAGKVLKLGVKIHAANTTAPGDIAVPTFVVNVIYG